MMITRVDFVFFFNDTATTEIYTLSLHDALPISLRQVPDQQPVVGADGGAVALHADGALEPPERRVQRVRVVLLAGDQDRKSTRLNSSHANISYAVFCLKKKKL